MSSKYESAHKILKYRSSLKRVLQLYKHAATCSKHDSIIVATLLGLVWCLPNINQQHEDLNFF